MSSKTAWISSDLLLGNNDVKANTLIVSKENEVYMKIDAEPVIRQELSDYFTFTVPGAKIMPAYRNRMWDGKMRLYNARTKELYLGLLPYVQVFAEEREYDIDIQDNIDTLQNLARVDAAQFITSLQTSFDPRDYQLDSFVHLVRNNRGLLVSPTASGKSFIIWLLTQWYGDCKTLIVVPTTSLVHQMRSDFVEYGSDENDIHMIMSGQEKNTDCRIVVSTWQSLYKMRKDYFAQYDVVIGDECHLFKAKSLTSIMTKLIDCKYRFGFTGTLDGTQTHKLVLEGLFGRSKQFVKTRELIDQEVLANFRIKALVLKYTESERKQVSKMKYLKESSEFKIASINPLLVVGSLRLFTFNVKYKKLTELVSNSTKGFEVSGSTIKNVDYDESREITLRHPTRPGGLMLEVLSKTKKQIDAYWNQQSTKTQKTNGRINDNTILLRVMDK